MENNRMERLETSSRKLELSRVHFLFFGTQPSLFPLGIASFLEDVSSLSNPVVFLYFFGLFT